MGSILVFMNTIITKKINLTSSITNDCFYPTYSPDKKYVFFTNYYSEADVFVLKREAIYKQRNN